MGTFRRRGGGVFTPEKTHDVETFPEFRRRFHVAGVEFHENVSTSWVTGTFRRRGFGHVSPSWVTHDVETSLFQGKVLENVSTCWGGHFRR